MYLRLIVEGLFGIRFNLLDSEIIVAPNFPSDWEHAVLKIKDASLEYQRNNQKEILCFQSDSEAKRIFSIPLRSSKIKSVLLNDHSVKYRIEPGIDYSKLIVESRKTGRIELAVNYGSALIPKVEYQRNVLLGQHFDIQIDRGLITEIKDPSAYLSNINRNEKLVNAEIIGKPGNHTVFLHVKENDWNAWLPVEIIIDEKQPSKRSLSTLGTAFKPVNISEFFNVSLAEIHKQEYWSPRPEVIKSLCHSQ